MKGYFRASSSKVQAPAEIAGESKARFDLIPPHGLLQVAKCLTVGAEKHGEVAYLNDPSRTVDHHVAALHRHLNAYQRGEMRDTEGFHHLAAVACRALMILELQSRTK